MHPFTATRHVERERSLLVRDDDCQVAIRQRLIAYREQTGPVLQWFGEALVRRVDGSKSADEVAGEIERLLSRPLVHSR